ncbi:hypothetical protein [Sphingobacterium hungaricum]|nr:hypothetical protein [Sphingobacterium hungaricum]
MDTSKNHTISKIVAKTMLRLFILLLGFAAYLYFSIDTIVLDNMKVSFPHQWAFLFPMLLLIIEIGLLFFMLKHKYSKSDINWLFSLNSLLLNIYLILLYTRIYPLLNFGS